MNFIEINSIVETDLSWGDADAQIIRTSMQTLLPAHGGCSQAR